MEKQFTVRFLPAQYELFSVKYNLVAFHEVFCNKHQYK